MNGWAKLDVTEVTTSASTSFSHTDDIEVSYTRTGDSGDMGGGPSYKMTFDTSTTVADPGTGVIRFSIASLSLNATISVIQDDYDVNSDQVLSLINEIVNVYSEVKGYVRIQKEGTPNKWVIIKVTTPWLSATGYHTFSGVIKTLSDATPFSNSDPLTVSWTRSGESRPAGSLLLSLIHISEPTRPY